MTQPTLSLVLPCLNEEALIARTVEDSYRWFAKQGTKGEIIVVNNGSTDKTAQVLEELRQRHPNLVIVTRAKKGGYGASVTSGCDVASMDIIATMDSDGQYDVNDLTKLLAHIDHVGFVGGIRKNRSDPWIRDVKGVGWNVLVKMLLGVRAKDVDCGIKLFWRAVWPRIRPRGTSNLFCPELYYRLDRAGIPWAQEIVSHRPRLEGKSKGATIDVIIMSLYELLRLSLDPQHFNSSRSSNDVSI